jgi:hypothetical protein
MKKKYAGVNNGKVEAAINKLGGMDGVKDMLSGKVSVLSAALFNPWKTLMIDGTEKECVDVQTNIMIRNCRRKVSMTMRVNLFKVSCADLGFSDGATREELFKRAKKYGLELCPAEVGVVLREEYKDQPKGENLRIATEAIEILFRTDYVLAVFRAVEGKRYISAFMDHYESWPADAFWIFMRRE